MEDSGCTKAERRRNTERNVPKCDEHTGKVANDQKKNCQKVKIIIRHPDPLKSDDIWEDSAKHLLRLVISIILMSLVATEPNLKIYSGLI